MIRVYLIATITAARVVEAASAGAVLVCVAWSTTQRQPRRDEDIEGRGWGRSAGRVSGRHAGGSTVAGQPAPPMLSGGEARQSAQVAVGRAPGPAVGPSS